VLQQVRVVELQPELVVELQPELVVELQQALVWLRYRSPPAAWRGRRSN
jgi:hypothetical protein